MVIGFTKTSTQKITILSRPLYSMIENKKFHSHGTISKSNREIVETEAHSKILTQHFCLVLAR